jgi:hypothetical protein
MIDKIVSEAPQDEVTEINKEEFETKFYNIIKSSMETQINNLSEEELKERNDENELVALAKINETAVNEGFEFIKEKKIKLNYNYTTTWTIFVILTFIALLVALMLKREDKRKNYGLEQPNIAKD